MENSSLSIKVLPPTFKTIINKYTYPVKEVSPIPKPLPPKQIPVLATSVAIRKIVNDRVENQAKTNIDIIHNESKQQPNIFSKNKAPKISLPTPQELEKQYSKKNNTSIHIPYLMKPDSPESTFSKKICSCAL